MYTNGLKDRFGSPLVSQRDLQKLIQNSNYIFQDGRGDNTNEGDIWNDITVTTNENGDIIVKHNQLYLEISNVDGRIIDTTSFLLSSGETINVLYDKVVSIINSVIRSEIEYDSVLKNVLVVGDTSFFVKNSIVLPNCRTFSSDVHFTIAEESDDVIVIELPNLQQSIGKILIDYENPETATPKIIKLIISNCVSMEGFEIPSDCSLVLDAEKLTTFGTEVPEINVYKLRCNLSSISGQIAFRNLSADSVKMLAFALPKKTADTSNDDTISLMWDGVAVPLILLDDLSDFIDEVDIIGTDDKILILYEYFPVIEGKGWDLLTNLSSFED